jgi:hypothetical protein
MSERSFAVGDRVRIIGPVVESNRGEGEELVGFTGRLSRERLEAELGEGRWVVWFDATGEGYAFVDEASIQHTDDA